MLPVPPAEVERNPLAMAEFESVTGQIRNSFQHVALLDRVHNMKVRAPPAAFPADFQATLCSCTSLHSANHSALPSGFSPKFMRLRPRLAWSMRCLVLMRARYQRLPSNPWSLAACFCLQRLTPCGYAHA